MGAPIEDLDNITPEEILSDSEAGYFAFLTESIEDNTSTIIENEQDEEKKSTPDGTDVWGDTIDYLKSKI